MKKISVIFFMLFMMIFMTGCFQKTENHAENAAENEVSASTAEALKPIYAKEIKNGTYDITVNSSSSMFSVIKCELIVENGEMRAVMTMSGQGYGKVYMGTAEKALSESEGAYIPFVLNENGEKTFTVPVEALDMEIDCAAWSIKKETWYDRRLIFESTSIPTEAFSLE